jgi:hypothetical protein
MGQYYVIVNVDKKEFIDPSRFMESGIKAWEIAACGAAQQGLGILLTKSDEGGGGDLQENHITGRWAGDRIWIVGDYDSSGLYSLAYDEYKDLSKDVLIALVKEGIFTKSVYKQQYDGYKITKEDIQTFEKQPVWKPAEFVPVEPSVATQGYNRFSEIDVPEESDEISAYGDDNHD